MSIDGKQPVHAQHSLANTPLGLETGETSMKPAAEVLGLQLPDVPEQVVICQLPQILPCQQVHGKAADPHPTDTPTVDLTADRARTLKATPLKDIPPGVLGKLAK